MRKDAILARISSFFKIDNAPAVLASMPTKDLNSLLIYLYEEKVGRLTILDILRQSVQSRFVKAAGIPQRRLVEFDHLAYQLLPEDYEGIELSPVAPLGINHVLAGTNQKNIMVATRNVEVIADPSTSLALECAFRRKEMIDGEVEQSPVRMATSLRNIRTQSFSHIPGFRSHFRIFALATAWCEPANDPIHIAMMVEHIQYYLQLIAQLSDVGYSFSDITVSVSDIRISEAMIRQHQMDRSCLGRETQNKGFSLFHKAGISIPARITDLNELSTEEMRSHKIGYYISHLKVVEERGLKQCRAQNPNVTFFFDLERLAGIGYYRNLCFKITASNDRGDEYPLVDGGMTDWASKLLRRKTEMLMVSGVGTELVCQNFRG